MGVGWLELHWPGSAAVVQGDSLYINWPLGELWLIKRVDGIDSRCRQGSSDRPQVPMPTTLVFIEAQGGLQNP